jgi:hypothetical protein
MNIRKVLRTMGLILFIILALSGIGVAPISGTKHFENEVKIEMVDKRREDEITSVEEEKEIK